MLNAPTRLSANFLVNSNPVMPTLPLPSRSTTTSSLELHLRSFFAHALTLHRRNCSVFVIGGGHCPSPRLGATTFFFCSWKPPLQALEHGDHSLHGDITQS